MTVDIPFISHNKKVIIKLIQAYQDYTQSCDSAYDDLAYLLLPSPHKVDEYHNKFLEPIATYLKQAPYQDFTKREILTKIKDRYPKAKLDANSSIAKIFAWSQQIKAEETISFPVGVFSKFTNDHWLALHKALKEAGHQSLSLDVGDLYKLKPEELELLAKALKEAGIKSLHIIAFELYTLVKMGKWSTLQAFLKKANIEILSLKYCKLGYLKENDWKDFCFFLQGTGIHSLSLKHNFLDKLTEESWQNLIEALKESRVETLDLSDNLLHLMNFEQWKAFCKLLKEINIKTLDLSGNTFYRLTDKKIQYFYQMLRTSDVLEVRLDTDSALILGDEYWAIMLQKHCKAAFKTLEQTNRQLEDLPFLLAEQACDWSFPLTDKRLGCLVKRLEASQDPIDTLMAGLLILGYCNNFIGYDNKAYWEKRLHDGISLLLQATNTGLPSHLERKANQFLWHLKVTQAEDFPSVYKRLGQFWLRPAAGTYSYFSTSKTYPTLTLNWRQEHRLSQAVVESQTSLVPKSLGLSI